MLTTTFFIDQTSTLILEGETPYKFLIWKGFSYDQLKVFGYLAFPQP